MTFLRPDFLYGLIAILIPIIIHLFNFRRHKKYYFSDISRLKNLTTKTQKQKNLKQLVVLTLRILSIIFIVVALADPIFNSKDNINNNSSINTIIIDNSLSMMAEGESGRVFESARQVASNLIEQSTENASFIILSQNQDGQERQIFDKESAISQVEKLEISSNSLFLSEMVQARNQILKKNEKQPGNTYIISDFQKNKLNIQSFDADSSEKIIFISTPHLSNRNIYIDSCSVETPSIMAKENISISIWVKNESDIDLEKVPLRLLIDGNQKAVSALDIKASSIQKATISFTVSEPGWHNGIVQIEDFPITYDDKLYFSFFAIDKIKILLLGKSKTNKIISSFYNSDKIFEINESDIRSADFLNIGNNDLIILNEIDNLSTGVLSKLIEVVEEGSNILFIPDTKSKAGLNDFIGRMNMGKVNIIDTTTTRVTGIKQSSPIFKNSIVKIPRNAELPDVYNYYRFDFPSSSATESLVTLLNGADFLIKKTVGAGQIYLLATSLQNESTNLSSQILFAPIMHGVASKKKSENNLYYTLGSVKSLKVNVKNKNLTNNVARLVSNENEYEAIPLQRLVENNLIIDFQNINPKDGHYSIVLADTTLAELSLNLNRNESVMIFANNDDISEGMIKAGFTNFEIIDIKEPQLSEFINEMQKESDFWKLFIIFALVTILAEILVLRFWK